jgi:hypothetical protein
LESISHLATETNRLAVAILATVMAAGLEPKNKYISSDGVRNKYSSNDHNHSGFPLTETSQQNSW